MPASAMAMVSTRKVRKAMGPPATRPKKARKIRATINKSSTASRLESLPTEVLFMVARALPSTCDVARLSRVSRTLKSVLDDADKSFWWHHFKLLFDQHSPAPSVADFARQSRMYRFLMKGKVFQDEGRRGPWCDARTFTAIKLLINESYAYGKQQSRNIDTMNTMVKKQGLFENLFRSPYFQVTGKSGAMFLGPALLTMLHVGLDVWTSGLPSSVCSFQESKAAAYHHPHAYPLFIHKATNESMNITTQMRPHATNLLLIANFFRFYIGGNKSFPEVSQIYSGLPEDLRPHAWRHHLKSDINPLVGTTHWKGFTAYVNHNAQERWRRNDGKADDTRFMIEPDIFDEETLRALGFFDLRLDFIQKGRRYWPRDFDCEVGLCEEALENLVVGDEGIWTDKADGTNAPFVGFSRSSSAEVVSGNMHPLNETAGINGFKRISWISAAADGTHLASSTAELLDEVNLGASAGAQAWAYEGVMLPGANIMIGRWWNATNLDMNGMASPLAVVPGHTADHPPEVPRTFAELDASVEWAYIKVLARMHRVETGPFIYWRVKDGPADGNAPA